MKRGFTLVEAVIVVAISAMALMALVNLFLTFNSLYGYQKTFIATVGSASAVLNAFEASILPAEQVLVSHSFSGTTYASATTTLVLQLPTIDSSGLAIAGVKDYVVFYTSSTTLYRRIAADVLSSRHSGLTTLSTTLNTLSLTYSSSNVTQATNVIVDLQTLGQYKQQTVQDHLREQLYLRNHTSP